MSLVALGDLFQRHRERATGIFQLGAEPGRIVYFDGGDIVFAQSTFPADRLTHLLVEQGKLTQAQMDYALASLKPNLSIGKNLIEMGFITQRDLLDVARFQVERIVAGVLATSDLQPQFTPGELEKTVVRLPMETSHLLLGGLLALKNREELLDQLGPLNQVVVLQGARARETAFPADLVKLLSFMDGTHTLLELSREGLAEPFRLGAFALFLREMGWARLHEMPPVAREALDLALEAIPEPLSPPLPAPPHDTVPTLFSTIEAAARPTANLEHLSQAIDALQPEPPPEASILLPDPPPPPRGPNIQVAVGEVVLPTALLAPIQEAEKPGVDARLPIVPDFHDDSPDTPAQPSSSRRVALFALALLLLAASLWGGWHIYTRKRGQAPVVQPPPAPAPAPPVPAPPPVPLAPPPEIKPEPTPVDIAFDASARIEALRKGDLALAVRQGEKRIEQAPKGHWTLRLEIACQGETIRNVADLFHESKPDLFLAPMTLRDGSKGYQIFCGHYATKDAAKREIKNLPKIFRANGNTPIPFPFSGIPDRQH